MIRAPARARNKVEQIKKENIYDRLGGFVLEVRPAGRKYTET